MEYEGANEDSGRIGDWVVKRLSGVKHGPAALPFARFLGFDVNDPD